jgi:DNA mismatch repair protein MutS2
VLVGLRVDEAVPKLEHYLDRAAAHRLPDVRIVHGFGTGRLQAAVHECLKRHPLVRRFRLGRSGEGGDPGGAGVTIVELGG